MNQKWDDEHWPRRSPQKNRILDPGVWRFSLVTATRLVWTSIPIVQQEAYTLGCKKFIRSAMSHPITIPSKHIQGSTQTRPGCQAHCSRCCAIRNQTAQQCLQAKTSGFRAGSNQCRKVTYLIREFKHLKLSNACAGLHMFILYIWMLHSAALRIDIWNCRMQRLLCTCLF